MWGFLYSSHVAGVSNHRNHMRFTIGCGRRKFDQSMILDYFSTATSCEHGMHAWVSFCFTLGNLKWIPEVEEIIPQAFTFFVPYNLFRVVRRMKFCGERFPKGWTLFQWRLDLFQRKNWPIQLDPRSVFPPNSLIPQAMSWVEIEDAFIVIICWENTFPMV